jgi:excinuclease ABC subunit C
VTVESEALGAKNSEQTEPTFLTRLERGRNVIKDAVQNFPLLPGVYRMLGEDKEVLYIGKAKNLKNRVASYTNVNELSYRIRRMVSNVHSVVFSVVPSESAAIFLEADLIRTLKPMYNVALKDATPFVSISISKDHDFPRVARHRGVFNHEKEEYCGPFSSAKSVDEALLNIYKIFKLRGCSDSCFAKRTRPCLQYDMKRCSAPCVGKIDKQEYADAVKHSKDFLAGKVVCIRDCLKKEMLAASDDLAFEKAARCRDSIRNLERLSDIEKETTGGLQDVDVIVLLHGENTEHSIVQETAFPCVYTLIIRNNTYLGGDTFFLNNEANYLTPSENIEAFIQQFYLDRTPPRRILLNYLPENQDLLECALKERHGVNTRIEFPRRGNGRKWIQIALKNAAEQSRYESAKQTEFGENLKKIAEIFVLPQVPKRVEIYDNSHIQGKYAYGCFVVATHEGFDKKSYRKFAVNPRREGAVGQGGDDFAMMEEVIKRRVKDPEKNPLPDLMLIDGGAGQVTSVMKILREYNLEDIMVIGIAKGPDRNAGRERFFLPGWAPISLPQDDPTLFFLQRVRDEAHRFAISTHRDAKARSITKSQLSDIPGVGNTRKKLLLQKFGSVQRIQKASVEELCSVDGISRALAKVILDFWR